MMQFTVILHVKARKKLMKIREEDIRLRLEEAFRLLSDPFNLDTVKMEGQEGVYRTRIGKYRIISVIERGVVHITDFDVRGKIYK
jgi:mRNA-degrading endonuclease RelE of RelBE toxin-antitoxin system